MAAADHDSVLFLLLLLCAATSAAPHSKISVPASLTPGKNSSSRWLSPSGKFAFGFYDTPNGYAVCIFLAASPERTVLWTSNNIDPILPNNVYGLALSVDGLQIWQKRDDLSRIYQQISPRGDATAEAAMLDNANFVLYNVNGQVIWQSFDHPTAALLPGQRLPSDGQLFSTASETDLAVGKFRLKVQADGLVQYPVGTTDTKENAYIIYDNGGGTPDVSLNLDRDGRLFLYFGREGRWFDLTKGRGHVEGTSYLARLDPDGILRLYNRSLDREDNWTSIWSSTRNRCAPKGVCMVNSFCSQEKQSVTCTCLPGFSISGGGCEQDFDVGDCRSKNTSVKYEITRMANVKWEDNYYALLHTTTEEDCGRACLDDCDCVVASFKNGKCRKQRLPLRYGTRSKSDSGVALFRVTSPAPTSRIIAPGVSAKPGVPQVSGSGQELPRFNKGIPHQRKYVIIGITTGVALLAISSAIIYNVTARCRLFNQDEESKRNVNKLLLSHGSLAPKRYTYNQIKKITKSFIEKLGQGGYGIVYKGKLADGQLVAVKVLTENHNNAQDFVNEVASISRTSHVNIGNLLGFCFERKKRALVYEFMPNKSLDKFIYKKGSMDAECSLEWKKLYEIAVGIARGLEYLHKGCNTRIIHFDIKPQNILLDHDLCPKISDFGLAKLCMMRQSVISMLGTRGTIGYIAPEVFSRNFGVVSHKSDVYSYGIMLLQMAEARINVETKPKETESGENFFLERMYERVVVRNEKVYGEMRDDEEEGVRKMMMVGFWCIQTAPADRPSMNNVVDMLEGNAQCIEVPPLPFLLSSPKPQFSRLLPLILDSQASTGA